MKKLIALSILLSSAAALAETTVSDVSVRQQWPWSTAVDVDFTVSNSTGALSQVSMIAYAGETPLGFISPTLCTGDTTITDNGAKRITFDPSGIDFLTSRGAMNDLRVDVSIRDTPDEEILYKIYDLTKTAGEAGQVTCVTEFDLTNGVYGAWERNYWGDDMVQTVIWTGVTQNDEYKTTKLVMRRIPAGAVTMGTPSDSEGRTTADCDPTTVTISQPYYMAVFETTLAQQSYFINAETKSTSTVAATGKYYAHNTGTSAIRNRAAKGTTGCWPETKEPFDSTTTAQCPIITLLRRRSGIDFDLPTEAQWEKAARAGSSGIYYSSNSQDINATELSKLAWSTDNEQSIHAVGLKLPNAYGLYDVLGNATEYVLDWYKAEYAPEQETDPVGPASATSTDGYKLLKGYSYIDKSSTPIHLGGRKSIKYNGNNSQHGYRLCCPAK